MTVTDLHPDELLWREACGTLSADERADLAAHLARCPVCALERVVRMEAARARVPSEADHAMAARLVDRVLAASERRPVAALGLGWRRRGVAVAAAMVLFVAGTAIAATALVVHVREQSAARARTPAPARESSAVSVPRRPDPEVALQPRAAVTSPTTARGAPSGEARPSQAASAPRDRRQVDNHRGSRPVRSATLAYAAPGRLAGKGRMAEGAGPPARPTSPASPTQAPAAPAESAPPLLSPSPEPPPAVTAPAPFEAPALLRRAEQARTARRWADARRAFADLARLYPGSREEIVGRALYGQVLLDQLGEPERALAMFERYLAEDPSGALADEARLGRAQALRRLGRRHDERAAWLELVRANPGSVHAAAARARLQTLDVP